MSMKIKEEMLSDEERTSSEEHKMVAGHIKSITVLYTAEIELRPVTGGVIGRKHDLETGTGLWSFE